ncbi:MAG TPA: sodium:calcium antiporter [Candidatus Binatia bacterium]|jgi:cation:H+ antiporter
MILWLQFAGVTAVIVYAGSNLSKYGDVIAEKTGMGRTWVGVILMASVTSLPELITGVSSVAIFELPDIAAGDVLGSCMFNILIIALLDVASGPTPIAAKAHQGQVLAAAFGILLLGLASMSIFFGPNVAAVGWVGPYSFVFLATYVIAMRLVFLYERKRIGELVHERVEAARYDKVPLKKAYLAYALNALLVIGAATYLPRLGDQIAEATGLGKSFVGSIFVALTTSLPEFVVSIAAFRIDATDLIFGNLLGSNLFNMAILALDDFLYLKGPLLADVSPAHIVTANAAMVMTAIAVIGLTYRVSKKRFLFAWDSLAIAAVYALAVAMIYRMG